MKNTAPPDRDGKFTLPSPEVAKFIESMGIYFENEGVSRIGGRILGLLLIAHQPLSAEEIANILQVSRGSVSTNIRLLLNSGLVEKVAFLNQRLTYFAIARTAWEQVIRASIQKVKAFKDIAAMGLAALPQQDMARGRLEEMIAWADAMAVLYENALKQWQARTP
jgi:DNA-binding transcriptional regulator GbsR (MarR family)